MDFQLLGDEHQRQTGAVSAAAAAVVERQKSVLVAVEVVELLPLVM